MSQSQHKKDVSNPGILVDFHVHTHYSVDSLTPPGKLIELLGKKVDRMVITDHNTIKGALQAKEMDPDRVIIGEEIMTSKGELLAVFVQEEIPAGLEPSDVIRNLRDQNAFISVSHPFDTFRKGSWQKKDLMVILNDIDAIEGFNARVMHQEVNQIALKFATDHGILITAGSDAHTLFEVGKAGILIEPFFGVDELRKNLAEGKVIGITSPWWVHLFSTYARNLKKRKKG